MTHVLLSAGVVEYEDTGVDRPVVVLLHGVAMDGSLWREDVDGLRSDAPSRGLSRAIAFPARRGVVDLLIRDVTSHYGQVAAVVSRDLGLVEQDEGEVGVGNAGSHIALPLHTALTLRDLPCDLLCDAAGRTVLRDDRPGPG